MNLETLENQVRGHDSTISFLLQEDHTSYLFYTLTYQVGPYVVDQMAICVVVQDRGGGGEAAYFKGALPPMYQSGAAFRAQVETAIAAYQVAHPELEYYQIHTLDEPVAIIVAYMYNDVTQETTREDYLLLFKAPGWDFRKIIE
jgi:hypothetical protein